MAILAGVAVPHQNLLARQRRRLVRDAAVPPREKRRSKPAKVVRTGAHLSYNVAQCEINAMPANSVVRARIDPRTKREAAAALKEIGLTVSDAFRLLLVRVAAEKALPFEPLNPNAETVAAMKAARRGELIKAGKPDRLLRSLNAGD